MKKLFLIDPEKRTIEPWDYNDDFRSLYPALGCHAFDCARFNEFGDGVYVDDEGLLKGPTHFFMITGYPNPLAGRGIVHGVDEEGETVGPHVDLEWLKKNVIWVDIGNFLGMTVVIMDQ